METFSREGVKSRISSVPVPFLFPLWVFEKEGLIERRNEFVFAPPSLYSSPSFTIPGREIMISIQKSFFSPYRYMICI